MQNCESVLDFIGWYCLGTQLYVLAHDKEEFSTPTSNSYKCAKEQLLNLTSQPSGKDFGGELKISHFQVQAFRSSNSTKFDEGKIGNMGKKDYILPAMLKKVKLISAMLNLFLTLTIKTVRYPWLNQKLFAKFFHIKVVWSSSVYKMFRTSFFIVF